MDSKIKKTKNDHMSLLTSSWNTVERREKGDHYAIAKVERTWTYQDNIRPIPTLLLGKT